MAAGVTLPQKGKPCASSRFPLCPRFIAGPCLFEGMKQHLNALRVFEKLWEASKAVADCKMSAARGGEKWALEEHTLYRLEGFAALAGYLSWSVLQEESLRVFSGKGVPCINPVES